MPNKSDWLDFVTFWSDTETDCQLCMSILYPYNEQL